MKKQQKKISESINTEIKKHNEEGFLRYCTSARVKVSEKKISISRGIMKEEGIIVMFITAFMTTVIHNHLW